MTKIDILKMNDAALDKTVKIQGTSFDRKRTITDDVINKMKKLLKKKDASEVAKKLGMCTRDILYHTDPEFKKNYISKLSGKHTGKDHISINNRIAYKRELVAAGKVTA